MDFIQEWYCSVIWKININSSNVINNTKMNIFVKLSKNKYIILTPFYTFFLFLFDWNA